MWAKHTQQTAGGGRTICIETCQACGPNKPSRLLCCGGWVMIQSIGADTRFWTELAHSQSPQGSNPTQSSSLRDRRTHAEPSGATCRDHARQGKQDTRCSNSMAPPSLAHPSHTMHAIRRIWASTSQACDDRERMSAAHKRLQVTAAKSGMWWAGPKEETGKGESLEGRHKTLTAGLSAGWTVMVSAKGGGTHRDTHQGGDCTRHTPHSRGAGGRTAPDTRHSVCSSSSNCLRAADSLRQLIAADSLRRGKGYPSNANEARKETRRNGQVTRV